ncbi:ATP-dependent RNA helicase [Blastocystis sp. subtype 4]|uniref:ATP-dependent RNA helicase n=1 Tax=Blastocystis sp. subtype 4 TaxID=944170 RepID=UPI000711E98B|nr:ATP-dependent RNA helicase [Blastocystis sp. subtype 4]KNB41402.1 ATP-dependent RNA helicase [Blastocystis sp. subtype 4]|eukprot:XP_014524845.1 ATP-dependent RNA helicase [Blastocystis sp. subtype 4]
MCHPRCIVVAPTRELATQVGLKEIYRLGYKLMKEDQIRDMIEKKASIIISTPGRVLDLMNLEGNQGEEKSKQQYLSLDRLNLMFSSIPPEQKYQTVCCSATYTDRIRDSVNQWCPDRYEVEIPNSSLVLNSLSEVSVNPLITQDIHLCSEHKKIRKLFDFIRYVQHQDELNHVRQKSIALIFVNKMKTGEYILDFVRKNWAKGPSGRQKQGRFLPSAKPTEESEENDVKNLRIDFLHSKMAQPYPLSISSSIPSFHNSKQDSEQFQIRKDPVSDHNGYREARDRHSESSLCFELRFPYKPRHIYILSYS